MLLKLIFIKIISINLISVSADIHLIHKSIEQYHNYSINVQNSLNNKFNKINFIPNTIYIVVTSNISNIILPDLMKWINFTTILIDPLNINQVNDKFNNNDVYFLLTANECGKSLKIFIGWINNEHFNDVLHKCEHKNRMSEIIMRGKKLYVGYRQMIPFIYKSEVNNSILIGIEYDIVKIIANKNNLKIQFIDCTKLIDCLRR